MTDLMTPIFVRHASDPWAAHELNLLALDHLGGTLCACGAEKPANDFECDHCFITHDFAVHRSTDI
jgi:hypothetical protein